MAKEKKMTSDAVKILHNRYIKGKPKRLVSLAQERVKSDIAEQIYEFRMQAGLSQKELAERVGTTQSVISRLESTDYDKYSLPLLRRIAAALHLQVQVKFVPETSGYAHSA